MLPAGLRARGSGRLLAVLGLLLLSPYAAELLSAYHGPVTNPVGTVLVPLAVFAPLYGTAAVLIRELVRRTGRGWPSILLLSAAFGLIQAGLIDQSLLDHEEMAKSEFWDAPTTLLPIVGVDASQLLTFVVGHVIWSFAAPIAVVEATVPRIADRPWLGRFGIAGVIGLYLLAAVFFMNDLVLSRGNLAPPVELAGVAFVVLVLMVTAFRLSPSGATGSTGSGTRTDRPGWRGAVLPGVLSLMLLTIEELALQSWAGVAIRVAILLLLASILLRWSARSEWTRLHVAAVAGAALLSRALVAFLVPPLGTSMTVKLISSTVVLFAVLGLVGWGWCRTARTLHHDAEAR